MVFVRKLGFSCAIRLRAYSLLVSAVKYARKDARCRSAGIEMCLPPYTPYPGGKGGKKKIYGKKDEWVEAGG